MELAQLEYTLPRLTGAWVHFSRQYGGIGSKGPGETQLEIDRRQVRTKIAHLKERLSRLDRQRATQRKSRQELFKVSLVGYTNAGKSTLFNKLTKGNARTANMLFTTLDSTTRVMSSGYPCRIVFSDTVGFIRKLPHQLVESFKSTLEETVLADFLLHILDASNPEVEDHLGVTRQVLKEIGAGEKPEFGRWTYWEKFDYFAVFWGVAIIGVTGLILWFPVFATRLLPGWMINVATVIHSDEALLAAGFIFTIHFFNTHFRPGVFPMDPVIFTGRMPLEEFKHERAHEYQHLVETGQLEKHIVGPPKKWVAWSSVIFGLMFLLIGLTLVGSIIYGMLIVYV